MAEGGSETGSRRKWFRDEHGQVVRGDPTYHPGPATGVAYFIHTSLCRKCYSDYKFALQRIKESQVEL
jgi:hypothetical protein